MHRYCQRIIRHGSSKCPPNVSAYRFMLAEATGPLARHHLHTSETQNQKEHRLVAMPQFVDSHGDEISARPLGKAS
jgi:hypothetical protein